MIRIVTLSESNNGIGSTVRLGELTEQLRLAEIDVLCCQGMQRTLDSSKDPVGKIAESLEMTYSFSVTGGGVVAHGDVRETTIRGLAILAGPHVWMLNSGSFAVPGDDHVKKQIAQFAVIRQNSNWVLIINAELSSVAAIQFRQLRALFSHQLLHEQYDAVLLCSSGKLAVSAREVQAVTALSPYKLVDEISAAGSVSPKRSAMIISSQPGDSRDLAGGIIFAFTTRKPAPNTIRIKSPPALQPASGLTAEFEFQRTSVEKSNKLLFPLSFSEQRLEIRESYRAVPVSTP